MLARRRTECILQPGVQSAGCRETVFWYTVRRIHTVYWSDPEDAVHTRSSPYIIYGVRSTAHILQSSPDTSHILRSPYSEILYKKISEDQVRFHSGRLSAVTGPPEVWSI